MAVDVEFKEKLRSLSLHGRKTPSKKTVDHTDTAVVTTTTRDESQDVNVRLTEPVRPHCPEMTRAFQENKRKEQA